MKQQGSSESSVPLIDHDRYVPFLIISISNGLYRGASQFYQSRFGVGVTEWRVLSALAIEPNSTANRLCQIAQLDKAAASRSLRVLEQGNFVHIEPHETDARKLTVTLTPEGFKLYNEIFEIALKRQESMVAGLSADETETLIGLLQRLRNNVQKLDD